MVSLKTRSRILLLVLAAFVLLSGCATTPEPPAEPADPEATTISLTDHLGREIELEEPAHRVIGTHNPSMNMVVVLDGGGERFVGFGNKDMAYGLYDLVAPEINAAPQIGKGKTLNMETVVSVEPDLMVLPARFKAQIDDLTPLDIPCVALDVEKFDSIKSALTVVGKAIGQDARAEELISFFDKKITDTAAIAAESTEKPSVLMLSGSSKTAVATDAMLQNLMIETAGGTPASAGFQPDELWTEVNIEQIISWNPDVIFIPVYANYSVEEILDDPAWASINAVKQEKVFAFPSKLEPWDYPTAASVLGLCWTCHVLHPEIYGFEALMNDVNDFYQFVYDTTFTAEQLGLTE